jgi:hypothetical protein
MQPFLSTCGCSLVSSKHDAKSAETARPMHHPPSTTQDMIVVTNGKIDGYVDVSIGRLIQMRERAFPSQP